MVLSAYAISKPPAHHPTCLLTKSGPNCMHSKSPYSDSSCCHPGSDTLACPPRFPSSVRSLAPCICRSTPFVSVGCFHRGVTRVSRGAKELSNCNSNSNGCSNRNRNTNTNSRSKSSSNRKVLGRVTNSASNNNLHTPYTSPCLRGPMSMFVGFRV